MRRFLVVMCGLVLTACANEDAALIDRYVDAMGGAAAIEAVHAIRIEVEIDEPGYSLTGHYSADRIGDMRVDVYSGDTRVFSEGLSDGSGWQMFADGTIEPTSADGTAALWRGVERNLFGLHEFAARGHAVSSGDEVTIDGVTYPTLDIVMSDGFEERLYLDPVTLWPVRQRSEFALHPDIDPGVELHETRQSDFREVDGIMKAFLQETVDLRSGETVQTVRIVSIDINPVLEPGHFDPPTPD